MRGMRQRCDREVAQSMPYWATDRNDVVTRNVLPVQQMQRSDDDIDFDYVSDGENELEFEQVDDDHGDDDDLLITPVVKIRSAIHTDKNENFACSAPVVIGTPLRERENNEEYGGAESYWGSALHKTHLTAEKRRSNVQN